MRISLFASLYAGLPGVARADLLEPDGVGRRGIADEGCALVQSLLFMVGGQCACQPDGTNR